MGNERDYLRSLHEFDKWLKANAHPLFNLYDWIVGHGLGWS